MRMASLTLSGNPRIREDVVFPNVPSLERRKLRPVPVGAGYSGLTLAYKIQHGDKLEDVIDFQIYEKNDDVGGTWYENTYPGAAW